MLTGLDVMPDPKKTATKPKRGTGGQFKKSAVPREEVFELYVGLGPDRTLAKLKDAMQNKHGVSVVVGTLSKWARAGNWKELVLKRDLRDKLMVANEIKELEEDGTIGVEHINGLLKVVVGHAQKSTEDIQISTVAELEQMVSIADHLRKIVTQMRGGMVAPDQETQTPDLGSFGSAKAKGLHVVKDG